MTTLALTQIPSDINTVEQLHIWCYLILRAVNGPKSIVEANGFLPEEVAQVSTTASPNDGIRFGCRSSVQCDPAFASDRSKKLWRFANELTVGSIPVSFTTN